MLRKKLKTQKNSPSSPSLCKYFPNIFLKLIITNICCCLFMNLLNWSPHFFHILQETCWNSNWNSCENSTAAEMGFNSFPIINQKWNWFQKWKPRCVFLNFWIPTELPTNDTSSSPISISPSFCQRQTSDLELTDWSSSQPPRAPFRIFKLYFCI